MHLTPIILARMRETRLLRQLEQKIIEANDCGSNIVSYETSDTMENLKNLLKVFSLMGFKIGQIREVGTSVKFVTIKW